MFGAGRLNTLAAAMAASGSTYVSASGGTVSYGSESGVYYKAHTFTSTGSFVVSTGGTVDSLIVGGGGPGGAGGTYRTGGGGGGGRVQLITGTTVTPQTYSITVGAAQTLANTVSRISSNTAVSAVIVVNVPAALVVEPIGVASMALALIRPPAKIAQPFVIVVFVPAVGAAATYNVPASVTVIALVLAMVGAAIA